MTRVPNPLLAVCIDIDWRGKQENNAGPCASCGDHPRWEEGNLLAAITIYDQAPDKAEITTAAARAWLQETMDNQLQGRWTTTDIHWCWACMAQRLLRMLPDMEDVLRLLVLAHDSVSDTHHQPVLPFHTLVLLEGTTEEDSAEGGFIFAHVREEHPDIPALLAEGLTRLKEDRFDLTKVVGPAS